MLRVKFRAGTADSLLAYPATATEVPQMGVSKMSQDDFFRGLLAALRLKGAQFIDTRGGLHHEHFERVVEELEEHYIEFPELPRTFTPSPFTGRYRELDEALVQLQCGLLGAQNPFYPGVRLDISEVRAKNILMGYPEEQQQFFHKLAQAFLAGLPVGDEAPLTV
jgi:hypothetical protein